MYTHEIKTSLSKIRKVVAQRYKYYRRNENDETFTGKT